MPLTEAPPAQSSAADIVEKAADKAKGSAPDESKTQKDAASPESKNAGNVVEQAAAKAKGTGGDDSKTPKDAAAAGGPG